MTLKIKVNVTSFQNLRRHLDDQKTVQRQNSKQFNFLKIKTKILEVSRPIRSKSPVFELVRALDVINTCFKFEGKIQNHSKVIAFTRNHTKHDDDATTMTQMKMEPKNSSPGRGRRHNDVGLLQM